MLRTRRISAKSYCSNAASRLHLIRHGYRRATFPRGEGFDALNDNLHLNRPFGHLLYGGGEGFAGGGAGGLGAA